MRPLVVLRPEPGASETAARARKLGLEPVVMPLFTVEPCGWRAPEPAGFDALLITSGNAIRHGGPELAKLMSLSVYAVGEESAAAAREAGFHVERTGQGGVDVLLSSIPVEARLLHLCGADWRQPVDHRHTIVPVAVYRSVELPVPEGFGGVEGAVIMVHSPRAAARLKQLAEATGLKRGHTVVAAISANAAKAAGEGWASVQAAGQPNDRALLALASRLCNNRGG